MTEPCRKPCSNCNGNHDDYYGEGYPCDQCKDGYEDQPAEREI